MLPVFIHIFSPGSRWSSTSNDGGTTSQIFLSHCTFPTLPFISLSMYMSVVRELGQVFNPIKETAESSQPGTPSWLLERGINYVDLTRTAISDGWLAIQKTGSWNKLVGHAFENLILIRQLRSVSVGRGCYLMPFSQAIGCLVSVVTDFNGNTFLCRQGL